MFKFLRVELSNGYAVGKEEAVWCAGSRCGVDK